MSELDEIIARIFAGRPLIDEAAMAELLLVVGDDPIRTIRR